MERVDLNALGLKWSRVALGAVRQFPILFLQEIAACAEAGLLSAASLSLTAYSFIAQKNGGRIG